MKKLFIITLAAITIAGYSQVVTDPSTTATQDMVAVQKASIVSLDASYTAQTNLMYVRYMQQRNSMVRQLEKLQSTNAPSIISSPSSQTPTN